MDLESDVLYTSVLEKPPESYFDLDAKSVFHPWQPINGNIYSLSGVPEWVNIEFLLKRLSFSERTLCAYRQIAWDCVDAYAESVQNRNPNWFEDVYGFNLAMQDLEIELAKYPADVQKLMRGRLKMKIKRVFPDRPPFPRIEAQIIIAIADLYANHKRHCIGRSINHVKKFIESDKYFWKAIK